MAKRPAKKTDPSKPYRAARRAHATEITEDYVEAIAEVIDRDGECRVKDLAAEFGVSHVTVTKTVARLVKEGLAETEPYRPIGLTDAGRELAASCRRRHEVVLRFLMALGVPAETAEIDAEGIEHHISPVTLERMERFSSSRRES
ncbi:MAG: manganese-binding transcriptional regulator MntR [Planctomycetota bacterium]